MTRRLDPSRATACGSVFVVSGIKALASTSDVEEPSAEHVAVMQALMRIGGRESAGVPRRVIVIPYTEWEMRESIEWTLHDADTAVSALAHMLQQVLDERELWRKAKLGPEQPPVHDRRGAVSCVVP